MSSRQTLLLYSLDAQRSEKIRSLLRADHFDLHTTSSAKSLLVALKLQSWDLLLLDLSSQASKIPDLVKAAKSMQASARMLTLCDSPAAMRLASGLGAKAVLLDQDLNQSLSEFLAQPDSGLAGKLIGKQPPPLPTSPNKAAAKESSPGPSAASSPSIQGHFPQPTEHDKLSLFRQLLAFHERCLQGYIALEKELLESRVGSQASAPHQNKGFLVLLVHTDPALGQALSIHLSPKGILVHQVYTGGNALEQAAEQDVDLIITQHELPDLSGEVIASSLQSELPYALVMRLDPSEKHAQLHNQELALSSPMEMAKAVEKALLFEAKAEKRKHIMRTFKEKHRDFMRDYTDLKKSLLEEISRLAREG